MRGVIPVFDGHNDTLTRDDADRFVGGREGGHIDLRRAHAGGLAGGVFALFSEGPVEEEIVHQLAGGGYEVQLATPIGHDVAAAETTRAAGRMLGLERAGHLRIVRAPGDLDAALADGVIAAVMSLEGAEAIDPGLEALELWYAAGVRLIGPVWSRPNVFGHGVPFAFPGTPDTGPGLTPEGVALVRRCGELRIAVDLSHLNEAGFWDVARIGAGPLFASHSGVHALSPATRNLTDAQLDAIGGSGGLVGVVFATRFLRDDGADDPDTPLTAVVEHVRYVADRIGVEHVALGSDFDGADIPAAIGDVTGLPRLLDALREDGFSDAELHAIAWGNWRRVLESAWGG
jgi:membrane dipeptidase